MSEQGIIEIVKTICMTISALATIYVIYKVLAD